MRFHGVLSFSLLASFALLSSAQADEPPAKDVPADSQQANTLHLRDTKLTVANVHAFGTAAGPATASPRKAKTEMSLVAAPREIKKPVAKRPLTAYEQAAEDLTRQAALVDPTFTGRAELSFVVGKKGQPMRAAVFGLSPALDQALTQHLATLRFPTEHAGQYYTTKLTVRATVKTKPARVAHDRKRRAKRKN